MTDEERLTERAQGCLLGQLTGDALGSMVEFMPADTIRKRHPMGLREIGPSPVFHTLAGQPTDDSELALALARTLLDSDGFMAGARPSLRRCARRATPRPTTRQTRGTS